MTATYQRWVRADGTPMVRVRGVGHVPSVRSDGPRHPLDGVPYEYDRQDYPPYPIKGRDWGDAEVGEPEPPPVAKQRAFWIDPATITLPHGAAKYLATAQAQGWRAGIAGAQDAEGKHLLSLLAAKPGRRVLLAWKWAPPRWTSATKKRPARWIDTGAWETTTALVGRADSTGKICYTRMTVTSAAKELG